MNCPVCSIPLTLAERQGVEIDYCPQCRGVWLDRGELDKILDRSAGMPPPSQPPAEPPRNEWRRDEDRDRGRDRDHERRPHGYGQPPTHHRPHKKREGWLGELFDFD